MNKDNMENNNARIGARICRTNVIADAAIVSHNRAEEMDVDKEMDMDNGNENEDSLFGPCHDQLKIDAANEATAVTKGKLFLPANNNTISTMAHRTKKRKKRKHLNNENDKENNSGISNENDKENNSGISVVIGSRGGDRLVASNGLANCVAMDEACAWFCLENSFDE